MLDHLQNLPGVSSAGMVMNLPLSGASMNRGFQVEGRPEPKVDENITMDYQVVSPEYFATLEVPIIRGRGFTDADNETSERVIVINQAMARHFWPNEDPIGKRMAIGESSKDTSWRTIVGIVGDVRHASLSETAVPFAFISYRQDLESWPRMAFVIKGKTDAVSLTVAVRRELIAIDPAQPVYGCRAAGKASEYVRRPTAVCNVADRIARLNCPGAGDDWRLWRDLLFSQRTNARDRYSDSAGRQDPGCPGAGAEPGNARGVWLVWRSDWERLSP